VFVGGLVIYFFTMVDKHDKPVVIVKCRNGFRKYHVWGRVGTVVFDNRVKSLLNAVEGVYANIYFRGKYFYRVYKN